MCQYIVPFGITKSKWDVNSWSEKSHDKRRGNVVALVYMVTIVDGFGKLTSHAEGLIYIPEKEYDNSGKP